MSNLIAALLCCCAFGCTVPMPDADGDGLADPILPAIFEIGVEIGAYQVFADAATALPPYLDDVPGVDGQAPSDVETAVDVPYRETPTQTLTLNVHRPRSDDDGLRRAVVFYMGGGALGDVDFNIVDEWAKYVTSRGFVTFSARQRLRTAPGSDPADVISDALAAIRFVAQHGAEYGADPARIGLFGRSSGGQLALVAGFHPDPDQFLATGEAAVSVNVRAIVDVAGPVDYVRLVNGADFSLFPRQDFIVIMGGEPDAVPDTYNLYSPLSYVRPGLPATMLVHGALDGFVPLRQSVELADRLEAAGNIVERRFYPHTGHLLGWGLFHNDGFGRAMVEIVRFYEKHL
ncbi:MAG: alpha/beta hydrolase [Planctomycetes bacterium]|nr:alpha/beta hydrolase [Planctomycetota bacterium]